MELNNVCINDISISKPLGLLNTLGILVRDDAARDELRRQVGEIGLIM